MKRIKLSTPFACFFIIFFLISCGSDDGNSEEDILVETPDLTETIIWTGPTISFEKAPGADPLLAENQDRISASVAITRGNNGGQIYNAFIETEADKDMSPRGTLWARGTTANLQNLTFSTFRGTLEKPKENVGVNLVMLLIDENIAIDVEITSWSQQQLGGFAYERSSEQ